MGSGIRGMLSLAIAIPCLNQSHFLPSALESLRFQSVPFEIALMDGGSTDGFESVAKQYSDVITYCRSGPDAGQAAAIREGFEKVDGDIVAWLNSDDYYFPGALDKVASCFEKNPELDVVYGDAIHVTREGFFTSYFPAIQEFNARDLTRSCFICQPACFVRRSAYEAVGGVDMALHYTMDWDLWCRLALNGAKFYYLHDLLAAVRYYPGTKTLSGDRLRYKEIWRIQKKYGNRFLPLSWPGFYYQDLVFKTRKTALERMLYWTLAGFRHFKKSVPRMKKQEKRGNRTLYGFCNGGPLVRGCGTIYMPWFDKRKWKEIHLRVAPPKTAYKVSVNGCYEKKLTCCDGHLSVDAPLLETVMRKISVECLEKRDWRLLNFYVEFVKE